MATGPLNHVPSAVGVARQAILDAQSRVFGYELLCRARPGDTSWNGSPDHASARVLDEALLALGLQSLTEGRTAFVNLSREILVRGAGTLLPVEDVAFEILETIEPDPDVIAACRQLHERGYRIALDDFEPGSPSEAFLPYASFVKVDVLATPWEKVEPLVPRLQQLGLRLVAEKVETREVYEQTKAAGFELFQGYFFCRPQTFAVQPMSARQLTHVRLMAALYRPNVHLGSVEEILKQDPALSVRILRAVNSAGAGLRRNVHSLREAVLLLGLDRIRKWAAVWGLASLNAGAPELLSITMVRARCCELLGECLGRPDKGAGFFLLGLCSLLDVMIRQPMAAVIGELPLCDETREALLGGMTTPRHVLDAVASYERGDWVEAEASAARAGLASRDLPAAFDSALRWSGQIAAEGAA
jgi:EAL and modified HD-GYP domain-containing signal transduction protein